MVLENAEFNRDSPVIRVYLQRSPCSESSSVKMETFYNCGRTGLPRGVQMSRA